MRKELVLLLLTVFGYLSGFSQYPGFTEVANPDWFKTKFSEVAKQTLSIKSDFVQEKNMSMISEKITSKGKFWFKKDNKVRMEYTQPFKYLMIINQNKIYTKDDKKENTISTKGNKMFKQISQIIADCVQGTALINSDFTMRLFESDLYYLVELTPVSKTLKDIFKTINLTAQKTTYSVVKIKMIEQTGDNTIVNFTNKEMNVNVPDALFDIK